MATYAIMSQNKKFFNILTFVYMIISLVIIFLSDKTQIYALSYNVLLTTYYMIFVAVYNLSLEISYTIIMILFVFFLETFAFFTIITEIENNNLTIAGIKILIETYFIISFMIRYYIKLLKILISKYFNKYQKKIYVGIVTTVLCISSLILLAHYVYSIIYDLYIEDIFYITTILVNLVIIYISIKWNFSKENIRLKFKIILFFIICCIITSYVDIIWLLHNRKSYFPITLFPIIIINSLNLIILLYCLIETTCILLTLPNEEPANNTSITEPVSIGIYPDELTINIDSKLVQDLPENNSNEQIIIHYPAK